MATRKLPPKTHHDIKSPQMRNVAHGTGATQVTPLQGSPGANNVMTFGPDGGSMQSVYSATGNMNPPGPNDNNTDQGSDAALANVDGGQYFMYVTSAPLRQVGSHV